MLGDEIAKEKALLQEVKIKEAQAQERYDKVQEYKHSLLRDVALLAGLYPEQLQCGAWLIVSSECTVASLTWTGVRLGWAWICGQGVGDEIQHAQEEVERRQKSKAVYEVTIADAQVRLQGRQKESNSLIGLIVPI